jgi:hypothetical protein
MTISPPVRKVPDNLGVDPEFIGHPVINDNNLLADINDTTWRCFYSQKITQPSVGSYRDAAAIRAPEINRDTIRFFVPNCL